MSYNLLNRIPRRSAVTAGDVCLEQTVVVGIPQRTTMNLINKYVTYSLTYFLIMFSNIFSNYIL